MQIRNETPQDRSEIATLIARTYLADGARTIEITGLLRDLPQYNAKYSFVAEDCGNIVSYALFTHVEVGDKTALLLAPLALDTKNENFDIDKFLIDVLTKLKNSPYSAVLMHGSEEQYIDMGFENAKNYAIDDGINASGVDLLIKNLTDSEINLTGKVKLPECLL